MAKYFIDVRGVGENYFRRREGPAFSADMGRTRDIRSGLLSVPSSRQGNRKQLKDMLYVRSIYCAMADLAYEYNERTVCGAGDCGRT